MFDLWSPERVALATKMRQGGASRDLIAEHVSLLPGPAVTAVQVRGLLNKLGIVLPPGVQRAMQSAAGSTYGHLSRKAAEGMKAEAAPAHVAHLPAPARVVVPTAPVDLPALVDGRYELPLGHARAYARQKFQIENVDAATIEQFNRFLARINHPPVVLLG